MYIGIMYTLFDTIISELNDLKANIRFFKSKFNILLDRYKSLASRNKLNKIKKKVLLLKDKYYIFDNLDNLEQDLKTKYSMVELLKLYYNITKDNEFIVNISIICKYNEYTLRNYVEFVDNFISKMEYL